MESGGEEGGEGDFGYTLFQKRFLFSTYISNFTIWKLLPNLELAFRLLNPKYFRTKIAFEIYF